VRFRQVHLALQTIHFSRHRLSSLIGATSDRDVGHPPEGRNTAIVSGLTVWSKPWRGRKLIRRGGLPPRVLQRICEHIEAHIEEKISVDALATLAGLSAPHFTRAFRHSAGLPPHTYVLRRLERALSYYK
jgi:hypothetical protein